MLGSKSKSCAGCLLLCRRLLSKRTLRKVARLLRQPFCPLKRLGGQARQALDEQAPRLGMVALDVPDNQLSHGRGSIASGPFRRVIAIVFHN